LLDSRSEREKQKSADCRQANSFDPLEELEAPDKSLQERGEFLIFFLAHYSENRCHLIADYGACLSR
jgi:hypothetical protein